LHLIHDLFARWLKCILVVAHQLFNNGELCFLKGELLLKQWNVTAHKVGLKRITDLVLDAHPTHATEHAPATTLATAAALALATTTTTTTLSRRRSALLRKRGHGQQRLRRNNGCDDERS
jgi:hypothetical protein